MKFLVENYGYFQAYSFAVLFVFLRYALFAGIPFYIFYKIKKSKLASAKIQKRDASKEQINRELGYSAMTIMIFSGLGLLIYWMNVSGWTMMYSDINDYGIGYFVLSVFILLVGHDTYFYWMHRTVHHPKLFMIFHKVHHLSSNPTPWTSFSFDATEALVELAIIPVILMIVPIHPGAVVIFFFFSLAFNVLGHLGYELMPKGWVHHPISKWVNTSTHHNMHHKRANANFGLYFNFWDTWMGTNHKNYVATFDAIVEKREEKKELLKAMNYVSNV